jgi:hypothetical protein
MPGLAFFIPNRFDRQGVALMRPFLFRWFPRNLKVKLRSAEFNQTRRFDFSYQGVMSITRKDLETLRLLRAFVRITDPQKRKEIIELVEKSAPRKSDERSSS